MASNVGRMLEDGMDSSSEKNDVVRHVVPRRIPVVCWEARHLAASKSFPSPSSSRACRVTSSMPSIRDPPRANIVKRTTSLPPKHAAEVNVQMNKNLRLKSFSRRPSSRHAPTLRRLERDVVSAELCLVDIVAHCRDSSTPTTSSSHSSVMAVVSACTSN